MRYLATGARTWSNWRAVEEFCRALMPGDIVGHGGARGLDGMITDLLTNDRNRQRGTWRAHRVVVHGDRAQGEMRRGRINRRGDIELHIWPAQWDKYRPEDPSRKNPAGPIRNRKMHDELQPDRCVFFNDDVQVESTPTPNGLHQEVAYPKGSGTGDMVSICIDAGVLVYHWEEFLEVTKGGEP